MVELAEKLSKMTKEITNKTQNAVEVIRLQSEINREKDVIEGLYKEIGKVYFSNYKQEGNELFTEMINRIDDANAEIKELQYKINNIKGTGLCYECNKAIKQDMMFCPYCGAKVMEEEIEIVKTAEECMDEKNDERP